MTSTTPDIHHTGHPPHQTSTTPDIHHTMGKIGHRPHQTSTTPDLHHTMWGSGAVDVLFYTQCGGCLWWMSGLVGVQWGGCGGNIIFFRPVRQETFSPALLWPFTRAKACQVNILFQIAESSSPIWLCAIATETKIPLNTMANLTQIHDEVQI